MNIFIYAFLAIVVLALILSGKLRVLIKGFINIFIEDLAKTPEGAEAVYSEAINEAQEAYNEANDTFRKVSGQYETTKNVLSETKSKLADVEKKCESLAKAGNFEDLELLSEQRKELISDAELLETQVERLLQAFNDAKQLNNHYEKELIKIKKEKKKIINELKMNKQMEEMYDYMDKLKNTKDSHKLLSAVKEKIEEGRESVAGARSVHENRTSTKLERADQRARKASSSSYVEQLKSKYNK